MKLKIKARQTRTPMNEEELRKYYEQIKVSARVSENRKAYKRSRDKKVSF